MKILQVITTLGIGGAERFLLDLAGGLHERGHEVQVAWLKGSDALKDAFRREGLRVRREHPVSLRRALRGESFDLVHSHLIRADLWTAGVAGDVPHLRSQHNDERALVRRWVARTYRRLTRESGPVTVPSEWVARFLRERVGEPEKRIVTIPYRIDLPTEEQLERGFRQRDGQRGPLGWRPDELVVLVLGRLAPQKGQTALLRALRSFPPPDRVHLWFVGARSSEREARRFDEELEGHPWRSRVRLQDVVEDPAQALWAADVVLVPSLWEGFGRVALEAMAFGRPLIAHRVSALPEVVGRGGLLLEPGNGQELVEALVHMRDDPADRASWGQLGRERAHELSPRARMIEDYEEVYRRLLESRP